MKNTTTQLKRRNEQEDTVEPVLKNKKGFTGKVSEIKR